MSIELKIKSIHLGVEAKIIRNEVNRLKLAYQKSGSRTILDKMDSLTNHRKWDVRNENRATFLARAYLSGQPYSKVEQGRKVEKEDTFQSYVLPRVVTMVNKYGGTKVDVKTLQTWSMLS